MCIRDSLKSFHEDNFVAGSSLDPVKDPDKVFAGRMREFGHLIYFETYKSTTKDKIPEGARRVDMRWEERSKGDECRSRLVLRDYNKGKLDEMFAATPSAEGLRLLLVISSALDLDVMCGDLNCGFMHAEPSGPIFAKPPADAHSYDKTITKDTWWKCKKAINGGRAALKDFNDWFGQELEKLGFVRLRVDSQMFANKELGVYFHVHVDDPCAVGSKENLHNVFAELSKVMLLRYTDVVKVGEPMKHLGDDYKRTEKGWIQRPAKDYVRKTLSLMNMEKCNPASVLGSNEKLTEEELEQEKIELEPDRATVFRQVIGKCTFY